MEPWSALRALLLLATLAVPARAAGVTRFSLRARSAAAAAGKAASTQGSAAAAARLKAPTIDDYRRWTNQYAAEANEAKAAAKQYSQMSQAAMAGAQSATMNMVPAMMKQLGADNWAYATWHFEQMLDNPAPGKAGAAAAKAAAPYNKKYSEYDAMKNAYAGAAVGYALSANMDGGRAKQLMAYSNQYALQGNDAMAKDFAAQASSLMKQADGFKATSKADNIMARKIFAVLPTIQTMAGTAATHAAWVENPLNAMPAKDVFPFTPAPPTMPWAKEPIATGAAPFPSIM